MTGLLLCGPRREYTTHKVGFWQVCALDARSNEIVNAFEAGMRKLPLIYD